MKLEMLNCPKCQRLTIQVKTNVPNWYHGGSSHSAFTKSVTVCSICGSYIQRIKVWQEKYFDPQKYDLD